MFEKEADEYRKAVKSEFFLSEPHLDLACQGFKDGYATALREMWHTADSPKQDGLYYCKIKSTVGVPYYRETEFINGKWNIVMGKIIAWCEMPKYEEAVDGKHEICW